MKYTTHDGYHNNPKNKLQQAVQDYLKSIDRLLIKDNNDLKEFKTNVIANIVFLNNEHPRCSGVDARWMEIGKDDWLLSVRFSDFRIYHVKKDYNVQR